MNPYFKQLGFTPNGLTAVSALFGFLSVYFLYQSNYLVAAGLYAISYAFDCFDGHFARTYNQVTKFGDLFDHIKDIMVNVLLGLVLLFKKDITRNHKIQSLLLIFLFHSLMSVHLSCQEEHYHANNIVAEDDKSECLQTFNIFKGICGKKNIKYTRYFGCGTANLVLILALLSCHFKKIV